MTTLYLPKNALVVLIGAAASGKSTFAKTHFEESAIVSSDRCRWMISGSEDDQACSAKAFELFHSIIDTRLSLGQATVADATNLQAKARNQLRAIANQHNAPICYFLFDVPLEEIKARAFKRAQGNNRFVPEDVLEKHVRQFGELSKTIQKEPVDTLIRVAGQELQIRYCLGASLWAPGWDFITDIHGCAEELAELIAKLGYYIHEEVNVLGHDDGRRICFLGDLCDGGPYNVRVLKMVMQAVSDGAAKMVLGNHDRKLLKYLQGKSLKQSNGLAETIAEVEAEGEDFKNQVREFLEAQPFQLALSAGTTYEEILACHAGVPWRWANQSHPAADNHAIFGEHEGFDPISGYPKRSYRWTRSWQDKGPLCIFGHTAVKAPTIEHNCINIDTGALGGNKLTAFRFPESDFVSVASKHCYFEKNYGNF